MKNSGLLPQILSDLVQQKTLALEQWQWLVDFERADDRRAQAFGYAAADLDAIVRQRGAMLQQVYPAFQVWCDRHLGEPALYLPSLWWLWLPLAQRLEAQRQGIQRPFVQGILGGQGTGKTTLGHVLTLILQQWGLSTLSWSLDDLYKTYRDRCQLQVQDPRLVWRGPPGTHDVTLGLQVLDQLRQGDFTQPVLVPRFDKSLQGGQGDRIAPEPITRVDIILFEGWFVGVHPIDPQQFENSPAPITTERDRAFAQAMNHRLQEYVPLWQRLDRLWVLYLPDYRLSKHWRKQAEHTMKATGKPGMTDDEIDQFVDYFWRALHPQLFIPPALQSADLVIEINLDHTPGQIYTQHR